jgi:hypothetical protein
MVQRKKDTSHDDPYRRLVESAAERSSLRWVLREAGILNKEALINQWLNGRKDRKGVRYPPPLESETREKLFSYLKFRFPKEMREIEEVRIFGEFDKSVTKIRPRTELDGFADFVRSGAVITSVTPFSVTAEGGERAWTHSPYGGLTGEVYERLASDDVLPEALDELAWAVVENLLHKKGFTWPWVLRARLLVPGVDITSLLEQYSFDDLVTSLANRLTGGGEPKT